MARVRTMASEGDDKKVTGPLAAGQRWSVARKREVVLRILRGESLDALSRELAVPVARLEAWRDGAVAGMEAGLRERGENAAQLELEAVKARLGEVVMENEILKKAAKLGPFGLRRSRR